MLLLHFVQEIHLLNTNQQLTWIYIYLFKKKKSLTLIFRIISNKYKTKQTNKKTCDTKIQPLNFSYNTKHLKSK